LGGKLQSLSSIIPKKVWIGHQAKLRLTFFSSS